MERQLLCCPDSPKYIVIKYPPVISRNVAYRNAMEYGIGLHVLKRTRGGSNHFSSLSCFALNKIVVASELKG